MAIDPDVMELLRPIQEAVTALQAGQDALQLRSETQEERIVALEARPMGGGLFAARDNLETALFSAMRDMTDDEQITFMNGLSEQLKSGA